MGSMIDRVGHPHGVVPFARIQVAALAVLVLLGGCDNGSSHAPSPTPSGGVLRVITLGHVSKEHGDPVLNDDLLNRELFRCCLARTLLSYTGEGDAPGTHLVPDLASGFPDVSADRRIWTFHLRHGLHYGPPLQTVEITAGDFVHALNRAARVGPDENTPGFERSDFFMIQGYAEFSQRKSATIAGLEVPDRYTLKVRLVQPWSDLGYRFSTSFTAPIPPLPGDESAPFGAATGHDTDYGSFMVSSGPYMIEGSEKLDFRQPPDWQEPVSGSKPDGSRTLVRNPAWSHTSDPLRPAYVDRIEIRRGVPSRADAAARVLSGEADLALIDGVAPQAPLDTLHAVREHPDRGSVDVNDDDNLMSITMNLAVPPFDDVHVRRAVAYAIDRQRLLVLRGGEYAGSLTGHVGFDTAEDNDLLSYDPFGAKGDAAARLQSARAEMMQSRYDSKHEGACDAPACAHVKAAGIVDEGRRPPEMGETVKSNLRSIGINLDLSLGSPLEVLTQVLDPTTHTAMTLFVSRSAPDAGGVIFGDMYTRLALAQHRDPSLVGATGDQLRAWGYGDIQVPDIEDRFARCLALFPSFSRRCWTELDQYVTEELVADVPLVEQYYVEIVPHRVVSYSYDQAMVAPAFDHVAIEHP